MKNRNRATSFIQAKILYFFIYILHILCNVLFTND
jgi:hypothetical protein